jgi:DNA topoisomerase-3
VKNLVIAEKPSMGRDISEALSHMSGQEIRSDGLCQHVGQYTVIGAQGHLFSLASPEQYGQAFDFPWRIEPLPVLPDRFILEPNFQREKGRVVNSSLTQSIRSRLAKIKELMAQASTVVHAGDPDREGQLIVDDLLRQFNFKGPVLRLWLHAQTIDGIQEAWRKMADNVQYANLGMAALARRESDWVIGMNATRAYSALWWKKGHKGILNIGRVVTPVVGMVVQREKDIQDFVPKEHYGLKAQIRIGQHPSFVATWIKPVNGEGGAQFDPTGKLVIDRRFVINIKSKCDEQKATIGLADTVSKRERPPLLLSLVELQKMAARMGYSPDEVLSAAQALYEKYKLISYPRTECQFAPESEHAKAKFVIKHITANFAGSWHPASGWDASRKSAAWDDKKLAEHFAIMPLPTSCPVSALSKCERDVYRLICRQYLAQFFPYFEYLDTALEVHVLDERFRATGRQPTAVGWRTLYGGLDAIKEKGADPDSDEQVNLPPVNKGDVGFAGPIDLDTKQTKAPSRFTSITLLEAMEKAYLFATDLKVKARLKQVEGLGTAATRASIIARAVTAGLVAEDRGQKIITYLPTPKAFGYIQSVSETLIRPDLTAWFEGQLEALHKGELNYGAYQQMLARLVEHVLRSAKDGSALARMPSPEDLPAPLAGRKKRHRGKATATTRSSPTRRKVKTT